ncbi:hypothetical protein HYT33_02405 [Candidatus Roizmanbacteria bacterium]|nr:hypothetical protein [Candidatus Roizmanbacteria bacterium]
MSKLLQWNILFKVVGVLVIAGLFALLLTNIKQQSKINTTSPTLLSQKASVDYEASFGIFTHGAFRVFTAAMYHNQSPDVFIQADNPNIIHVKKTAIAWNDFFKTLPFKLTKDCLVTGTGEKFCTGFGGTLQFFLNGVKDDGLLDKTIQKGDRALITFGNENEEQVLKQFQKIPPIK